MVTTLDMTLAYDDCLRNKRSSHSAASYEAEEAFEDIPRLAKELSERSYEPGESVAFIVRHPRPREVFAAFFRDRNVHHWMCAKIEPLLEDMLSPKRFNCRKGKGTLAAVKSPQADIEEASAGYTRDCWIAKGDLKGFFMSIDKAQLATMADMAIAQGYKGPDIEDLRWTTRKVVTHSPEKKCVLNSPESMWKLLSADKSLRTNGEGKGVPIGNLPSQDLANLLLHFALDTELQLLEEEAARSGFVFRWDAYVDDFAIVCDDKGFLLKAYPRIRESLERYGLRLNERKNWIQHHSKGAWFIGEFVKFGERYPSPKTEAKAAALARKLEKCDRDFDADRAESLCARINSYLGLLSHCKTRRMRRRILWRLEGSSHFETGKDYEKVVLRKQCRRQERIKDMFRKGAPNPWELSLAGPLRRDSERAPRVGSARRGMLSCN